MGTIRTLVLSGGGGRGAFHAGVYRYLCQGKKAGVDAAHQGSWQPDIVVGTSIGAVNGAAIVQGYDGEQLAALWEGLREQDIEGLPPGMTWFGRAVVNRVMRGLIGTRLPQVPKNLASSPPLEQNMNLTSSFGKMGMWALGKWGNLLDTGPLRCMMRERMKLDEAKIAASERTLLINTTQVSTGQNIIFANRPIYRRSTNQPRPDVVPGITLNRIMASCSIPMVYPWTRDAQTGGVYWDGALGANTPLGAALDAAADRPAEDVMEAVVVMMTPWRTGEEPAQELPLPSNLNEAITYALDWMLLSSFRERLALMEAFNRLAEMGRQMNDALLSRYRIVRCTIVAPQDFFPAARILDYDAGNSKLIDLGVQAAERAFLRDYPSQG